MSVTWQTSLLDQARDVGLRPLRHTVERSQLGGGAWVDVRRGWVWIGGIARSVAARGAAGIDWQSERRQMFDRVVDTPRLLRHYDEGETLPDPILAEARGEVFLSSR